jgi:hypothetical protein
MARMIRSAIPIESEIAARNFGDGGPPFQSDILRDSPTSTFACATVFFSLSLDCSPFSPLPDCLVPTFDTFASGLLAPRL